MILRSTSWPSFRRASAIWMELTEPKIVPVALVLAAIVSLMPSSSLSGSLGISLDFCNLVDTLLLVFGELLQGGFGSDDGFSLRDEVIAAVTVLYLDNIVFIAESGYILFKYQFHNESFLSGG